mgnify:CR=1 FL=1
MLFRSGLHDPVHVEWLHDRWSYRLNGADRVPRRPTHVDFRWLEFEHGVEMVRPVIEGPLHNGDGAVVQVLARKPR